MIERPTVCNLAQSPTPISVDFSTICFYFPVQVSLLQTCRYSSHKGHRASLRPKNSNHLLAFLQPGALLSQKMGPPHREELPLHQTAKPAAVGNQDTEKMQLLSRISSCSPLRAALAKPPDRAVPVSAGKGEERAGEQLRISTSSGSNQTFLKQGHVKPDVTAEP